MSHHRSPSPGTLIKSALSNFKKSPQSANNQEALETALEGKHPKIRLEEYLKLQKEVEKCNWLNNQIAYELSNNGRHEEALTYWKGRFLKYPENGDIRGGLGFALNKGLPPASRLTEVKDLEKKLKDLEKNSKVDHRAAHNWIRTKYITIQAEMGNYEESLQMLHENWQSSRFKTGRDLIALTTMLDKAVEKRPKLVMDYLSQLADRGFVYIAIFMSIPNVLDDKGGESTSYLKKCTKSEYISLKHQCFAYIYLAYMHGRHESRHNTEQKHDGDKHKAHYIEWAILQSDRIDNSDALDVVEELQKYEFPKQAAELCLRRMKKDPWGNFKKEFIRLKKPRSELEEAHLLYDTNPDVPEYAKHLLDIADQSCKTPARIAEVYEKVLIRSESDADVCRLATKRLVIRLRNVETNSAIDTWKRLILACPKELNFRDHLSTLLDERGILDHAITVWGKLEKKLNDADSKDRYREAKQKKKFQEYQAKLQQKWGDKWDTKCPICMVNDLDTVLVKCGHVCCGICAKKLDSCHICRAEIRCAIKVHAHITSLDD
jgi:tetratricopeptide (TPR) repeat protein